MGNPFQPRAGVDYPRTFQEFDEWFATEAGCRDYLVRLRWPTGFGRCQERWRFFMPRFESLF